MIKFMKQLMKKTLMGAALATSLVAPSLTWGCDESKHETKTEAKAEIKEAKNARPPARPFRDDLSTYNETLWHKNGPWANDGIFRSAWRPENVIFKDGIMTLRLDDTKSSGRDYTGAEIGSHAHYGYGRYEVRMKPAKNPGVISSFFTYTGPPHGGNPHHEIDIEFVGNDTTILDMTYYTDGKGYDPGKVKLGFDAAEEWHVYGFEWTPESIVWLVDGKEVGLATAKLGPIPSVPGEIMTNLWATQNADGWAGPFEYSKPIQAHYDWMKWTPLADMKSVPRETK
jgi:endo-1,3-1,4-beta-glycanase ExoK